MRAIPFLLLAAGLACAESAAPTLDTTSRVPERERLLSDAELATPIDPSAASVPAAWAAWAGANTATIRSLTSRRFDDLAFLKTAIGDRRLVQLGESGHGVREFNLVKVRLIRYLHEEMGFDVIAFESGLHECWVANEAIGQTSAITTMRDCIFGVWHTAEVLELFDYLIQTRSTSRPLKLAGFDVQVSSLPDSAGVQLLRDVLASVDTGIASRSAAVEREFMLEYARLTRDLMGKVTATVWLDSVRASFTRGNFLARFDSVRQFLDANAVAIDAAFPDRPHWPIVARQLAFSRSRYAAQVTTVVGNDRFEIRDLGMADNIGALAANMYSGEKIIIWAHNAHIQHDRPAMRTLNWSTGFPRAMGSWLRDRHRPDLYTIGLFMYTGSAADNGRRVYAIARPLANSLEAVLYHARKRWVFVDMLSQPRASGTEWMYSTITAKEWGMGDYRMIMRDQFDGIVFIHTVSPPEYR